MCSLFIPSPPFRKEGYRSTLSGKAQGLTGGRSGACAPSLRLGGIGSLRSPIPPRLPPCRPSSPSLRSFRSRPHCSTLIGVIEGLRPTMHYLLATALPRMPCGRGCLCPRGFAPVGLRFPRPNALCLLVCVLGDMFGGSLLGGYRPRTPGGVSRGRGPPPRPRNARGPPPLSLLLQPFGLPLSVFASLTHILTAGALPLAPAPRSPDARPSLRSVCGGVTPHSHRDPPTGRGRGEERTAANARHPGFVAAHRETPFNRPKSILTPA